MLSGPFATIVGIVVFFWLTPYIRYKLGNQYNGLWWSIMAFVAYLGLINSIGTSGIIKYVAECRATADDDKLKSIISTSLLQYFCHAALVLVGGGVMYYLAGRIWSPSDTINVAQVRGAFAVMTLGLALSTPFACIHAIICGLQRQDFVNFLGLLSLLLRTAAIVLVLNHGLGLVALAVCAAAVPLLRGIAAVIFLRSISPLRFSWACCHWHLMKELLRFGWFNLVITASDVVNKRIEVIAALISPSAVTVYGLGQRLFQRILDLTTSAVSALMPVASEISILSGRERSRKTRELFTRGSRFSAVLILPMLVFLLVFGHEFIAVWQGPDYADYHQSFIIFAILVGSHILAFNQQIGGQMLLGFAAIRFPAYVGLTMACLNLGLSIVLAFRYGIVGVALGTAVRAVLRRLIMQFYYRKVFQISLSRYYWDVWSRLAPMTGFFALALTVLKRFYIPTGMVGFLVLGGFGVLAFWMLSYWTLDAYEREVVAQIARKLVRRPRQL